jgi:methionine-rich copper-binding protein CopC
MNRRPLKITTALLAAAAIALLVAGCAFVRPGSLTLSQPAGIGAVRVHFVLCTLGEPEGCGKNEEENVTVQYLAGIAVPPGSTPPQAFTATSTNGGAPITFTRNEEVAPEITASSASLQQLISEGGQKEKEDAEALKPLLGGPWPPPGLQGVGYLSAPVEEVKNKSPEWTVDADFGLPAAAQAGQPFAGPFGTGVAFGFRVVKAGQPANRAVHCLRFSKGSKANESEAFCTGSLLEGQLGSADLGVGAPAKAAQAFVGGSAELAYPLKFAGGGVLSFALSATSTAKGAKTKISPSKFTPGTPDASTHLSATGTGKVTVTVPKSVKPGTYKVTLTATAPQGGSVSGVGTFKVVKAKIKFGKVKLNSAKGLATLPVKVPGAGKLTISGKGIAKTSKKSKKAQSLKMKIKATGSALSKLKSAGSVKVKAKATFKPSSGISVSKTKTIVLKLG